MKTEIKKTNRRLYNKVLFEIKYTNNMSGATLEELEGKGCTTATAPTWKETTYYVENGKLYME